MGGPPRGGFLGRCEDQGWGRGAGAVLPWDGGAGGSPTPTARASPSGAGAALPLPAGVAECARESVSHSAVTQRGSAAGAGLGTVHPGPGIGTYVLHQWAAQGTVTDKQGEREGTGSE